MLNETQEYLNFAAEFAKKAGEIVMEFRGRVKNVEWTARTHFRTEIDTKVGELVRREIGQRFPEHNIHSEEFEDKDAKSPYTWVIDELDGTIPYFRGTTDHFSVCISLCENGVPIIGVVNACGRGEMYTAEKGKGAFCNSEAIHVGDTTEVNHVIMGIDPGKFDRQAYVPFINRAMALDGISCFLQSGCASVPLCLVASGKYDAYLATSLNPEDMAAAVCIIREAGGKVTNLKGEEWKLGDASILAANPALHEKLSDFFKIGI
ncbi:MAG: inositol monophosphatase family protein [Patescibacteria group bacterium]